jgi:hypothetical protein
MTPIDFDKILLSAVEESLSTTLGNSSKQAIFYHLESSFKIKRENIPSNLNEFENALEGIFGPGAPYLEKVIAKSLLQKLGIENQKECTGLVECVSNAKRQTVPSEMRCHNR